MPPYLSQNFDPIINCQKVQNLIRFHFLSILKNLDLPEIRISLILTTHLNSKVTHTRTTMGKVSRTRGKFRKVSDDLGLFCYFESVICFLFAFLHLSM